MNKRMSKNMVKKLSLLGLLLSAAFLSNAQQDPQFSYNMFNQLVTNPGFSGINQAICATAVHRTQWMGFEGHPVTTSFAMDAYLESITSGVGLIVLSDNIGFEKNVGIKGNYAYQLEVGDGTLGIGIALGFNSKSLDGDWSSPASLEDANTNVYTDPAIPHSEKHGAFDMGFGAFYSANNLYGGLGINHVITSKYSFEMEKPPFLARHYYLTAGYNYQLPNPLFELRPSIFIKSDGVTNQYNLNMLMLYNKRFWGGLSYRFSGDLVFQVGMILPNNLKFGLAYDFTMSDIGSYTSGSVEVFVSYCFNMSIKRSKGTYKSVRFL